MSSNEGTVTAMAEAIYSTLGSGYAECVYQKACEVFLRVQDVKYDAQHDVAIMFMGHQVGRGIMDLLLHQGKKCVVELKAIYKTGEAEYAQLKHYMVCSGATEGYIVNFGQPSMGKVGKLSILRVLVENKEFKIV